MTTTPNAGNEEEVWAAREAAARTGTLSREDMAAIAAETAASNAQADAVIADAERRLAEHRAQQAAFGAADAASMREYAEQNPTAPGQESYSSSPSTEASASVDKRIRIRCRPGKEGEVYGPAGDSNPMGILHETNGIVFPYTPTIQYQQNPLWQSQELTHFIQQYYYFTAIESAQINISGKFSIQNAREGRYLLAVFHFLRSYSKMHFGLQEPETTRGLPPPVLLLDGYGSLMFNNLPIIIRTWNIDFPDNVDYVKVSTSGSEKSGAVASTGSMGGLGDAYLPAVTNVNIVAMVQRPPNALKSEFNLAEFRNGNLLRSGKGFT